MIKRIKNNKGVTIIELLVVFALIGITIALAPSLHIFGIKVFAKGENKSNVQFDARMAIDYITKDIRYSSEVEILADASSIPDPVPDDYCYIYSQASGGSADILYKDKTGTRTISSFSTLSLNFSTAANKILKYSINGDYNGESFSIYSDVRPLNMPNDMSIINNAGTALRYKKIAASASAALFLQPAPPSAMANEIYTHSFNVTGGSPSYTYAIVSGALPTGISLDTAAGIMSGTPTVPGSYSFTIKVTDSSSPVLAATRAFTMLIGEPGLTAATVAARIDNTTIPFPNPVSGDAALVLPLMPYGFSVVIQSSSNEAVVALDGTITPQSVATNVTIKLKVINLIDNTDTAVTGSLNKTIPAAAANAAPVADNVEIAGTPSVGSILTGSYAYLDNEGDLEGASIKKWYRSSTIAGAKTDLPAGPTYKCEELDLDKYIYFEITPIAESGTITGETKLSPPVLVLANNPPTTNDVIILNGTDPVTQVKEGDVLTASYVYFDTEGDEEYTLLYPVYTWYMTNKVGGSLTKIHEGDSYTVTTDNNIKFIYLGITIKAKTGADDAVTITKAYVERIK